MAGYYTTGSIITHTGYKVYVLYRIIRPFAIRFYIPFPPCLDTVPRGMAIDMILTLSYNIDSIVSFIFLSAGHARRERGLP